MQNNTPSSSASQKAKPVQENAEAINELSAAQTSAELGDLDRATKVLNQTKDMEKACDCIGRLTNTISRKDIYEAPEYSTVSNSFQQVA